MVALKAGEVAGFLARPDPARPIALVFGPDAGLVNERATALVRAAVDDLDDPFSLVRLTGDDLAADPSRLLAEADTIPLFGGRRAVWVKAAGRDFAAALEALVTIAIRDCRIVIEAGDLRRNAPLRVLGERAANVAVIACYPDGERELAQLIDTEMRAAGLAIAPDARAALLPLLGGDRRASRSELNKLALYARGKQQVELDDVAAVVADASTLVLDTLVDMVFAGRAPDVETSFARVREAGMAPGRVITAALNQVGQLHRARVAIDGGAPIAEAAEMIATRAGFRRQPAIEAALKAWTAPRLERAMAQLADASLDARRLSGSLAPLADSVVSRVLLTIATAARRKD